MTANNSNEINIYIGLAPIDIRIALLRLGVTQAQIARDLEIGKTTVSQVISGDRRSKRVEEYIKKLLSPQETDI